MKKALTLSILFLLTLTSCFNEEFLPELPIAENPITVNSDLYTNLQSYVTDQTTNTSDCIKFIYPISISVFDNELEFVNLQIIENKDDFIEFLAGLQTDFSISVSYPIIYTNNSGEEILITNNEILGEKLQECIDIELELYCIGLLIEDGCLWRVLNNPNGNTDYDGAVFKISSIGITTFEHNDRVIFGSWTVAASFNQLFFNIFLDDNTDVALVWNKNWRVTIIDENNMMLQHGDSEAFFIERNCSTDLCPKYIFEQCETEVDSDSSSFDLESYIDCFASNLDISNATVTFFGEEFSAINATNQITSPYTNINNPKYIFVRIEDNDTGEFSIIKILLAALSC